MRHIALVLAGVLVWGPWATAAPIAAPGWTVSAIEHDLEKPSGAAFTDDALLVTDLATGRIVRLTDGGSEVVHDGLPVGDDILGAPTGPYKIQTRGTRIFVAQGWQDVNRDESEIDHAILELSAGGTVRALSNDFWNPYDFVWDGNSWLVADAGRNSIARLSPDGEVSQLFAIPDLEHRREELRRLSPTEFNDDESYFVDAVPTGLAVRDQRVFIAVFGGFPFLAGGGAVISLPLNGPAVARLEVIDLDAPIDLAFADDGSLLVLEHGRYDAATNEFLDGTGRLSRVDLASGERQQLLGGLTQPVTVVRTGRDSLVVVALVGMILRLAKD